MGLFDRNEKPKPDFSNVQGGSSTTDPVTTPMPAAKTYTVASGDSLSAIAKREYGDAGKWRLIHEANKDTISDPDKIFPGQVLNIPPEA